MRRATVAASAAAALLLAVLCLSASAAASAHSSSASSLRSKVLSAASLVPKTGASVQEAEKTILQANNAKQAADPNASPATAQQQDPNSPATTAASETSAPVPASEASDEIVWADDSDTPTNVGTLPDKFKVARLCSGHTRKADIPFCDQYVGQNAAPEKKAVFTALKESKQRVKGSGESKKKVIADKMTDDAGEGAEHGASAPPSPTTNAAANAAKPTSLLEAMAGASTASPPWQANWIQRFFGSGGRPALNAAGKLVIDYEQNPSHLDEASNDAVDAYNEFNAKLGVIQDNTCLEFPISPTSANPETKIRFQYDPSFSDCMTYTDSNPRQPLIQVGPGCLDGVLHEMFHALGAKHMMNHPSAWGYVSVNEPQLAPSRRGAAIHNMRPMEANQVQLVNPGFEFNSIMMYNPNGGCAPGVRCLTEVAGHPPAVGVDDWNNLRAGMLARDRDWQALRVIYGCPGATPPAAGPGTVVTTGVKLQRLQGVVTRTLQEEVTVEWWIDTPPHPTARDAIAMTRSVNADLPSAARAGHRVQQRASFKLWYTGLLLWEQIGDVFSIEITESLFTNNAAQVDITHNFSSAGGDVSYDVVVRVFRALRSA